MSISPRVLLNSPVFTHRAVYFRITGGGSGGGGGGIAAPSRGFVGWLAGRAA